MTTVTCVRCHYSTDSNAIKSITTCPKCSSKMHTAEHSERRRYISKLQTTGKADEVKVVDPDTYCCTHCGRKTFQSHDRRTTLCIFCISSRADEDMLCGWPNSRGTPCRQFGQDHYAGRCFHHRIQREELE